MNKYYISVTSEGMETLPYKDLSLQEMNALVGGYIEVVHARFPDRSIVIICNEEGQLLELPYACKRLPTGEMIRGTYLIMRLQSFADGVDPGPLSSMDIKRIPQLLLPMPVEEDRTEYIIEFVTDVGDRWPTFQTLLYSAWGDRIQGADFQTCEGCLYLRCGAKLESEEMIDQIAKLGSVDVANYWEVDRSELFLLHWHQPNCYPSFQYINWESLPSILEALNTLGCRNIGVFNQKGQEIPLFYWSEKDEQVTI